MGVVFDKLTFMKRLEDAGTSPRPQAETLSEAPHQAVSESVATKVGVDGVRQEVAAARADLQHDNATTRSDLRHEIATTRAELKHEIEAVRTELKHDIALLRGDTKAGFADLRANVAETKVWAVSVGASVIAVLAAIKYFG
jgi:hypothetical protein